MATVATGCLGQPGLVERGHLDQLDQLDALHQQLRDAIAPSHHDRRVRVEVDQRDLDLPPIARIDGARTVDDRKPYARGQTRARMDQPHHAERNRHRDTRGHQRAVPGFQRDILRAVQVYPGVALVGAVGQRKLGVKADNGQSGRHGATDYP